jgi:hypothetical protein
VERNGSPHTIKTLAQPKGKTDAANLLPWSVQGSAFQGPPFALDRWQVWRPNRMDIYVFTMSAYALWRMVRPAAMYFSPFNPKRGNWESQGLQA